MNLRVYTFWYIGALETFMYLGGAGSAEFSSTFAVTHDAVATSRATAWYCGMLRNTSASLSFLVAEPISPEPSRSVLSVAAL